MFKFISSILLLSNKSYRNVSVVSSQCFISSSSYLQKNKKRKEAVEAAAVAAQLEGTSKKRTNVVPIWKNMTVQELAKSIGRPIDIIFEAMIYVPKTELYDSPTSPIDDVSIIREIVKKCGLRSMTSSPPTTSSKFSTKSENDENFDLSPRPIVEKDLRGREPVVTIMGHVDHGKTTLLDYLRKSNIASGEAGGITQHIGAFRVPVGERFITFLDTPGHAAFSALRNRGAQATDIVVLVVAADDGVMEQTRESIRMARDANATIIVAINKIDKQNADVERTKSMLLQESIQTEEYGGDIQSVSISALKGTNINTLLDAILLQAELLNLRSEIVGRVEGVVLESSIDVTRGKLSTGLIQRGILRKGAILVAGAAWAKVRGIFNEHGEIILEAGPSVPCEIIGWREIPSAGDKIYEVDSERRAKQIVSHRESLKMSEKQEEDSEAISIKTAQHLKEYKAFLSEKRKICRYRMRRRGPREKEIIEDSDTTPRLNLVVKADVDGSLESFLDVLDSYDSNNQCRLDLVHYGIGDITETDVNLAEAFNASIYAFNVKINPKLKLACETAGVPVRESPIIYRLVENVKKEIEERLKPKDVEEEVGEGNVLQIFHISEGKKKVAVAGARCTKGLLKKNLFFKLVRGGENEIIYDGKVSSLRHLKAEVESVKSGIECGIALSDSSVEPQVGDILKCYKVNKVAQKTEWDPGF